MALKEIEINKQAMIYGLPVHVSKYQQYEDWCNYSLIIIIII